MAFDTINDDPFKYLFFFETVMFALQLHLNFVLFVHMMLSVFYMYMFRSIHIEEQNKMWNQKY